MDFSDLPDVVWVNILSFLSLADRAKAANTCHIINDVFHHPSLWYSVEISLFSGSSRSLSSSQMILPAKYVKLVEKFGKYFQNLKLVVHGYLSEIPQDVLDVLQAIGSHCRLEALTIGAGTVLSKRDFFWERPTKLDIGGIFVLIENAYRLRTLNIIAWPIHKNVDSPNILGAIRKNEKIKDVLENVSLFWEGADEASWVTRNAYLPSPDETLETLQHFNLRVLKLRSAMISDELIVALGKSHRRPLERFCILVTYSRHDHEGKLPEISNKAWYHLHKTSPGLKVDFTIVTRIPYIDLAGFLKPEIQVTGINFMKYSECRNIDLQSITDKYSKTLMKFTDYSQSSDTTDESILNLVTACEKLNYFVYDGVLHHQTVTHIAKLRSCKWYYFQINSSNVNTINFDEESSDGDNKVLNKKEDGTYELVGKKKSEEDDLTRDALIEVMIHEVAEYLGQKWIPMDWFKVGNIDEKKAKLYGGAVPPKKE